MRKGITLRGTMCRKVIKIVWALGTGGENLSRKMRNSYVPNALLSTTQAFTFFFFLMKKKKMCLKIRIHFL
jgi:hypothetical protein